MQQVTWNQLQQRMWNTKRHVLIICVTLRILTTPLYSLMDRVKEKLGPGFVRIILPYLQHAWRCQPLVRTWEQRFHCQLLPSPHSEWGLFPHSADARTITVVCAIYAVQEVCENSMSLAFTTLVYIGHEILAIHRTETLLAIDFPWKAGLSICGSHLIAKHCSGGAKLLSLASLRQTSAVVCSDEWVWSAIKVCDDGDWTIN